jgi:hypothetical protein
MRSVSCFSQENSALAHSNYKGRLVKETQKTVMFSGVRTAQERNVKDRCLSGEKVE